MKSHSLHPVRLALLACALAFLPAALPAQTVLKTVQSVPSTTPETAAIDFMLPTADQVKTVTATASGAAVEASKVKFTAADKLKDFKCAVLVVIDRTIGGKEPSKADRDKLLKAVRETVKSISAVPEGSPLQVGIATISAGNLEVDSAMPSSKAFVESATSRLRFDGASSDLFLGLKRGVDYLAGIDADRKFLVLISSGLTNDKVVTQEQVVQAAQAAKIHLCTIGYPAASDSRDDVQRLVPLADNTAGLTARADGSDLALPRGWVGNLQKFMVSGGRAEVNVAGLKLPTDILLTIKTEFDKTYTAASKIDSASIVAAPPVTPLAVTTGANSAAAPVDTKKGDEKKTTVATTTKPEEFLNLPLIGGIAAAVLVALAVAVLLLRRRKSEPAIEPETQYEFNPMTDNSVPTSEPVVLSNSTNSNTFTDDDDDATNPGPVVEDEQPFAWLVSLDGNQTRHPIRKAAIRIGRKPDNDIVLRNDSVSNHHAELLKRGDRFIIADLESSNKVFVNTKKVERMQLEDGDVIELGEVRFRFVRQ